MGLGQTPVTPYTAFDRVEGPTQNFLVDFTEHENPCTQNASAVMTTVMVVLYT